MLQEKSSGAKITIYNKQFCYITAVIITAWLTGGMSLFICGFVCLFVWTNGRHGLPTDSSSNIMSKHIVATNLFKSIHICHSRKSVFLYFVFYEMSSCPHAVLSIHLQIWGGQVWKQGQLCSYCHDSRHFNLHHGILGSHWLHLFCFFYAGQYVGDPVAMVSPVWNKRRLKTQGNVTICCRHRQLKSLSHSIIIYIMYNFPQE